MASVPSGCSRACLGFAAVTLLASCASTPPSPRQPPAAVSAPEASIHPLAIEFRDGPPWLRKCELAFPDRKHPPLCGVDGIIDASDPTLARTGAETKARANLAKRIKIAIKAGLVSYEAKRRKDSDEQDQVNDERHLEDTSEEIAEMTLTGVKVHDIYRSPRGAVWVLVALDMDAFRQQVQGLQQVGPELGKAIVEHAQNPQEVSEAAQQADAPASSKQGAP